MYKAKIQSIQDKDYSDSVYVDVTFYNEEKEFTKNFKFHSSNFKTTEDVQKFIQSECDTLDSFESMITIIKPLIGLDDVSLKMTEAIADEKLIKAEEIIK